MEFWKSKMTVGQCIRYINHIHRVPVVIANNGEAVVDDQITRRQGQWLLYTCKQCGWSIL